MGRYLGHPLSTGNGIDASAFVRASNGSRQNTEAENKRGLASFLKERITSIYSPVTNHHERESRRQEAIREHMDHSPLERDHLHDALDQAELLKKLRDKKPETIAKANQKIDALIKALKSADTRFFLSYTSDYGEDGGTQIPLLTMTNPEMDRAEVSMEVPEDAQEIKRAELEASINFDRLQSSIRLLHQSLDLQTEVPDSMILNQDITEALNLALGI